MSERLAVFNAERTIFDHVFSAALHDVQELGLDNAGITHGARRISEQRQALLTWITGKTSEQIEPLLERTTKTTSQRLAPWARIVMQQEVSLGNNLCIYSATAPEPLIDAYADGIEATLGRAVVSCAVGKELGTDESGRYTGGVGDMLKAETLESYQEDGDSIEFAADSFMKAWPALRKGKRRLAVNPGSEMFDDFHDKVNMLFWDSRNPHDIRVNVPHDHYPRFYDLTDGRDETEFLQEFGYPAQQ